jgi:hypothetical protein
MQNEEMLFLVLISSNGYVRRKVFDRNKNNDLFFFRGYSWFAFEITLRFIVAPSKKFFCLSILNWIGREEKNKKHQFVGE